MTMKGVAKRGRKKGVKKGVLKKKGVGKKKAASKGDTLTGASYVSVASLNEADDLKIRAVERKSEEFQDLVTSIKTHGFYDPILVTVRGDRIFVVDGYQRLAAAKTVGLTRVPITHAKGSRQDLILAAFDLNTRRILMTPMVEAKAVSRAMAALGTKQAKEVAKRMGRSERWVSIHTQLLELAAPLQKALDNGESAVSIGKCWELLRLHPEDRERFIPKLKELTEPFFRNYIEQAVKTGNARWLDGRKEPRKKAASKKTAKEQADKHARTPEKAAGAPVVTVSGTPEPVIETRSVADIQRACRKVEASLVALHEKRKKLADDAKDKAQAKKKAKKLPGSIQAFVDSKTEAWDEKNSGQVVFLRGQIAGLLYSIGLDPDEATLELALKKWRKAKGLDKPGKKAVKKKAIKKKAAKKKAIKKKAAKKTTGRKKGVKKAAKKKAKGTKKGLKKKAGKRKKNK